MRFGLVRLGLGVLAILVMVIGCTPAAGDAPAALDDAETTVVTVQDVEGGITVEGVVEPARVVTLRTPVGGVLTDVPVEEGMEVHPGTVLVHVDTADAELAVRRTEAALAQAEAQLALAKAGARDEQVAMVAAQAEVADAAVAQATAQRDSVTAGLAQADLLAAQADLLAAQLTHEQADEAHDDTMTCYDVPTPDGGEREICPTLGTLEEMARAQMEATYAGLLAAQAQLDRVEAGTAPEVAVAQARVSATVAQREAAEAQLALAQAGARREEVAVAEAGVAQARAALAQAQELLDQHSIEAPFDGVVTDLPVASGDTVAQGAAVATVAALDQLRIRTTDLTELDVAEVAVGQPVVVNLDAVPDRPLPGTVARIDPQGLPSFGDVIYDAIIELDTVPDWVRWGMTAQVTWGPGTAESSTVGALSDRTVIVEGTVNPERSAELQFEAAGKVAEVLVEVGDSIQAGQPVARLRNANEQLALATAEFALATAEAELALAKSHTRPEEIAAAEANLAAAEAGLRQAVAARDELIAGVAEAEIAGVQAQLAQARARRRQLEAALLWAEGDGDDERADEVRDQIRSVDLSIAAFEVRLAALPAADAARLRSGHAGVRAAMAQVAVAQATLDLSLAGPSEESIAVAEAAVQQAEVDVAGAQLALARTQLVAPFDGTVTQLAIEVGDTVAIGQPVGVLADLADLRVETTDLTELDVVSVREGQRVSLIVDALPGQSWSGHVRRVGEQGVVLTGDVTYGAIIELDEPIPGLRWGMTVAATVGEAISP
ncbi:MAG: efflux RND transporter periplasmic adaptor subunit [Anaerolineae bacterium]|nr:efflux RND transporter periplasmic adaptor subunit [Anaerolineae bacterium]